MVYRVLADAVMFVHFAFILFVAVGALLTWARPRMAWAHVPALAWGVGTVTIGFPCPLTSLEKALERRAGGDSYDGGFIDQYLEDVVYPDEYSSMLRALAVILIVLGYFGLLRRSHRSLDVRRSRHRARFVAGHLTSPGEAARGGSEAATTGRLPVRYGEGSEVVIGSRQ